MTGGRITSVPDQYDPATWRRIMADLDKRFGVVEAAVSSYAVANYTVKRDLNMATATATDIGNFLATLVNDLQKARKLGG